MERSFSRMDAEVQGPGQGSGSRNLRCRFELQARKCDTVGSTTVVAVVGPTCIVLDIGARFMKHCQRKWNQSQVPMWRTISSAYRFTSVEPRKR
ncbi:putative protein phosphatase 2C 30 [Ananas comosus]|uniref:Uncharacterized protein n=1 Tax=Ananas comosus TaxID=4615 RepID=A0A199VPH6_ANACO|nr:putative protein phosphatase 2C 30 [Ananas comosus]